MKYTQFTKRTDDPKLKWLEGELDKVGIKHYRDGYSGHGPIMMVDESMLDAAYEILTPIDDIPDNDKRFQEGFAWHLSLQSNDGSKTFLGVFNPPDGQEVMGCDMDEWMNENDHYGEHDPDDFIWEGDETYVAIMGKRIELPQFCFEWKKFDT